MSPDGREPFARLKKTAFSKDGSRAYLTFELPDASEISFKLLYESYTELVRGRDSFEGDDIARIEEESEYCAALSSALSILSFGGNTRLELFRKLRAKKHSNAASERAVDYVISKGYIDERALCKEEIESGLRKLWGETKIKQKLISRGFGTKVLSAADKTLARVDFHPACLKLARKKSPEPPSDYSERQKLFSYLTRQGYTSDVIRKTIEKLTEDFDG